MSAKATMAQREAALRDGTLMKRGNASRFLRIIWFCSANVSIARSSSSWTLRKRRFGFGIRGFDPEKSGDP
jgi:hypothetical protein